jgi:general stress protein 26
VHHPLVAVEEQVAGPVGARPLRALLAPDLERQRPVDGVVGRPLERERLGVLVTGTRRAVTRPPTSRSTVRPRAVWNASRNGSRSTTARARPVSTTTRSSETATAARALGASPAASATAAMAQPHLTPNEHMVSGVSRRSQIAMAGEEIAAFLAEQRIVVCATNGRDGWPHLMPLWYVIRDGQLWGWTYAKSQKARNMERDDRVTLQVEAGERYEELRGVMIKARVTLHRDVDVVAALGTEIFSRYTGGDDASVGEMVRAQAPKRVGLQFVAEEVATWDHRKLGGVY